MAQKLVELWKLALSCPHDCCYQFITRLPLNLMFKTKVLISDRSFVVFLSYLSSYTCKQMI